MPLIILALVISCSNSTNKEIVSKPIQTSQQFNDYWYNNNSEITSYHLEQARYGELHQGNAVLIFVTEPFSKENQVKADQPKQEDYSVMKLNFTKKFNTGIYPYSMITSSFVPINKKDAHAEKITASSQEWCGHTYTQINNKNGKYRITSFSYFESEGDQDFELKQQWLEDELWTKIRLAPELLPVGETDLIPSLFYVRLMHKELKAYKAEIEKIELENNLTEYRIFYPELERELKIRYKSIFPFNIEGWEETYVSGWGEKAQKLTTKATKNKFVKIDHWNKNTKSDSLLRKELGL